MNVRLSVKIFSAFVLMTITSVVLMVVVIRYASERNFQAYVHSKDLEQLDLLADSMAAYYKVHQSWKALKNNPRLWYDLLRSQVSDEHAWPPPGERQRPPLLPPRPGERPFKAPEFHPGPAPPPPVENPWSLDQRVVLLDSRHQHVVGPPVPPHKLSVRPISVDGQTRGWLGLLPAERLSHPLDLDFMRQQNKVFYLIGGAIFVFSIAVAAWLSRHLLAPIRRLAQATRDVTQRRFDIRIPIDSSDELGRLADDFNAMAGHLGAYERRQQQWLSDISHELRTPLAILIGEIEALQDGIRRTDPATLASLHAEASRLGKIISDLHDLAMAETGRLSMAFKTVNPVRILDHTLTVFETRLAQHGIALDSGLSLDGNGVIQGDESRLIQLFSNLIENTLRHTDPPGKLKIRQTVTPHRIILQMEDSAPSVPEEALANLFDRLYRVDPSRSSATGGSGLGLSICKKIVEAHNGQIQVRHSPLGGLAVEIVFIRGAGVPAQTKGSPTQ